MLLNDFTYEALPMRVRFAAGALNSLPDELEALGVARVLLLSTPEQKSTAEQVQEILGKASVGIFAEAQMHVPVESAHRAREMAQSLGADACVAIGGGS